MEWCRVAVVRAERQQRQKEDSGKKNLLNKAIPRALWSVSRLEASSGGELMAIFSYLIPAKHHHGKGDMTSRRSDSTGRNRRRRRRHSHHGHGHGHGHHW